MWAKLDMRILQRLALNHLNEASQWRQMQIYVKNRKKTSLDTMQKAEKNMDLEVIKIRENINVTKGNKRFRALVEPILAYRFATRKPWQRARRNFRMDVLRRQHITKKAPHGASYGELSIPLNNRRPSLCAGAIQRKKHPKLYCGRQQKGLQTIDKPRHLYWHPEEEHLSGISFKNQKRDEQQDN